MASVQEGDKVSWSWGGAHPSGTAAEVKPGEVSVTSHRGNEIKKTGDEDNPAVHIERPGNDVVKTAKELHVDKPASSSNGNHGTANGTSEQKEEQGDQAKKEDEEPKHEDKKDEPKSDEKNTESGKAQTGEKRKANDKADAKDDKKEDAKDKGGADAKKQKTTNGEPSSAAANGEKKRPGRPKGQNSKAKKEKKAPVVGRAERKTRSQGAA